MNSAESIKLVLIKRGANMEQITKKEKPIYTIFDFWQWLCERYFQHVERIEIIAANNWKQLCMEKMADFERRLSINGIT
jgi:hypothetical protein